MITVILCILAGLCGILHLAGVGSSRITAGLGIIFLALIPISGRLVM